MSRLFRETGVLYRGCCECHDASGLYGNITPTKNRKNMADINKSAFMAVDIGATSGRTIVGTVKDGRLYERELTRFANNIIQVCGHYYWDIYALYSEIVRALKLAALEGTDILSVGIDTWGCDFVLVGRDGAVLRNPRCYRDPHTEGAQEDYFKIVPKYEVYDKTGIQFMDFNTLFQLWAMRRNGDAALSAADKILFIPDALAYMLTGDAVCEYTVLSTSQLLNPRTRRIDDGLTAPLGLGEQHFGRYVNPGERVGTLCNDVRRQTGLGPIPVVAVAGHDTASAVAAVPAENERFAYLSCGTWSLLGIEVREAIINAKSFEYNFTNEGGIGGTTRFLKNICGLWLLERCRKEWLENPQAREDVPADITVLNEQAMEAEPFRSFINPDAPCFANPVSMVDAIRQYCADTGQRVPRDHKETTRCILESLAMRYRQVLEMLRELSPMPIETLHVIGGGSLNSNLMRMTANAVRLPVVTGPVEGTAIGNIMLQAKAAGLVAGMFDMRRVIARSVEVKTYIPADAGIWDAAYSTYLEATGRGHDA